MKASRSWITAFASTFLGASAFAQVTQRVSVSTSGAQGGNASSVAAISSDGRYVAFHSSSQNLVPGDSNGWPDIFLRDRVGGTTTLVSTASNGTQGNHYSSFACLSPDARFVGFHSWSTNLVPGDLNGKIDVFLKDRQTGATDRVSVATGGAEGNDVSQFASLSDDGRYVAFDSAATNLVPGDTNGVGDVFVRDRQTGTTERASVSTAGVGANSHNAFATISGDGRYVLFLSFGTNLVPGDTNAAQDVFLRDRAAGTTERVSLGAGGIEGNGGSSGYPAITPRGRYVAFSSFASNLVPGDTAMNIDVFLRDRQLGSTERISFGLGGAEPDGDCVGRLRITPDGRYVALWSDATNLVIGDTNGHGDLFVHDRTTGEMDRVSLHSDGTESDGVWSLDPSISADGRYVAFDSDARNLVPADTNKFDDVFVRDRFGGPNFTSLCEPGTGSVIPCPCSNPSGGFGQGCDNSSATGGALLTASGGTYLSSDSLVFVTLGEKPTALSILTQWTDGSATGAVFGMGVRCTSGTFKRLFTKSAVGGSITAPEFGAGDPTVSARSAALGDTILAGQSRWYFAYYRDPIVLGGCPPASTFNATQTGQITWSP